MLSSSLLSNIINKFLNAIIKNKLNKNKKYPNACLGVGAKIILTINNAKNIQNGIELTQMAYNYHLGSLGNYFIFITIFLFSFSTILTGYYDSEISLKTITNKYTNLLKIISLISIFLGTLLSPKLIWESIDIIVGILSLINIYSILKLKNEIKV